MKKLLITFLSAAFLLTACTGGGPRNEKQAFIDATIEATCMIFEAENIFDPALEEEAVAIYKKHGFDAEDDAAMDALTTKYVDDAEVQTAIAEGIDECAADFSEALGLDDLELDLEGVDVDADAVEGDGEAVEEDGDATE